MLSIKVFPVLIIAACIAVSVFSYEIRDVIDDDAEQSGDFESSVDLHKKMNVDPHRTPLKVDHQKVVKTFSNQQKQKQKPISPTLHESLYVRPKANFSARAHPEKPKPKQPNLSEDVNDFIEIIPKSEIKAKIEEYYRNDMDTQQIFEFMHGKEFQELRRNVLDLADVKDILQYLNRNGMNVKGIIRKIDNRLGISKIRPTSLSYASPQSLATNTTIGGLNGLVEDALAILPQDELFILFFEKLDNSPKFASFVQSVGNPDFHRKYTKLWKSKELHSVSAQLKKHKIDIEKIVQIFQGYFIFGNF